MIWVFIVLDIALAIACCVAYWYRKEWLYSEELSKHRLDMYVTCHDENDALVEKICRMEIRHKVEISQLNIQLENERFNKGIFEQKWKNAEEELMELRDKLPKRDNKGRFCKKN